MRPRLAALLLLAFVGLAAGENDKPDFDKDGLEAILKKEHSQKISNIYDSKAGVQWTWNIEAQELCPGVDGVCSKEEL